MKILIDTHIHIYPHYDTAVLLNALRGRVRHARADAGAILLAERQGVDVFAQWQRGENLPKGVRVAECGSAAFDDTSIVLRADNEPDVIVVAGRQIACAERIEVLALGTRHTFPDGIPIDNAVAQILAAGATPVLAWGVGKWLGKRKKIVETLLAEASPDTLLIGDSSLRPVFWPTPIPMRRAMRRGFRVIAGSDPLPPQSEAARAGQYANIAEVPLADIPGDSATRAPFPDIVALLKSAQLPVFGHRAGLIEFVKRMKP